MKLARKPLEGARLFHGIEVGALQVFDDRDLHGLLVRDLAQDRGDCLFTCLSRGPPASLTGDQLESTVRKRANENWLHDTVCCD